MVIESISPEWSVSSKTLSQPEVKIHPEFQKWFDPLEEKEFEILEASIIKAGQADMPLVIWNGYLLDGHHRFKICQKHGLPYKVIHKVFEDEEYAEECALEVQDGRRNITKFKYTENYFFPKHPYTNHREFRFIPNIIEKFIGALYLDEHIDQRDNITEGQDYELCQKIFLDLKNQSKRKEVYHTASIQNTSRENASSVPGGYMILNRGLLDKFEQEIIYSLSYSVGSLFCAIKLASFMGVLASIGSTIVLGGAVHLLAIHYFNKLSKAHEYEADRLGVLNAVKAGYHPHGAFFLQAVLHDAHILDVDDDGWITQAVLGAIKFFTGDTHPTYEERQKAHVAFMEKHQLLADSKPTTLL